MRLRPLLIGSILLAPVPAPGIAPPGSSAATVSEPACPGIRSRTLLGLVVRSLTVAEMVIRLEEGCLALDGVRFRPGQDTLESLSPAEFAQVARALGLARGAYRIAVPPESTPGWPPDTVQARRRGTRLRDELVHYGASMARLVDSPGWPIPPVVLTRGVAVPMLVRIPDPKS